MRIRVLLTSLIVAGLTLSTVQGALAAIKPGSACKKVGQVALESKKVYTCVKSGKKLIWNKGVAIPGGVVGALPTQSQPAPTTTTQPAPSVPKPPAIGTAANPVAAGTKVTIGKAAFRLEGTNNSVMAQVCADNGSRDGCTYDAKYNGIPDPKATVWWYAIKASVFNLDTKIIDVESLDRRFKLVTESGQLIEADSASIEDNLLANGKIIPNGSATGLFYFKISVGVSVKTLMVINDQSNWPMSEADYYLLTDTSAVGPIAEPGPMATPASLSGDVGSAGNPAPRGTTLVAGKLQFKVDASLQPISKEVCADNGSRDGCTYDSKYNGIPDVKSGMTWQALTMTVVNLDSKIVSVGSYDRAFKFVLPNGHLRDAQSISMKDALNDSLQLVPGGRSTGRLYILSKVGVTFKELLVLRDSSNWPTSTADYYFSLK
jgi:hypothetical protein